MRSIGLPVAEAVESSVLAALGGQQRAAAKPASLGPEAGDAEHVGSTPCSGKSAWSSYSKIENADLNQKFLTELRALSAAVLGEWVATEKVHGANFCFETDGVGVEYASRTGKLGGDAHFYNVRKAMPRYHPYVLEAFRLAKERSPNLRRLLVFGEYFGGYYPGLPVEPGMRKVQPGIAYSPTHHFYAFDVSLNGPQEGSYMDFDDARELLLAAGFPLVAAPLRRGALEDVINIDVETLETTLPDQLGHPPLEQWRIAEGIVVRPARESEAAKLRGGGRPILKKKSKAFWEATNQHGMADKMRRVEAGGAKLTNEGPTGEAIQKGLCFLSENRLRAVISKDPSLLDPMQQMKLTGLFMKDVWQDFSGANNEELKALGKEVDVVRRQLAFMARCFVTDTLPAVRDASS